MSEQHIIENLDAKPFGELSENELSQIEAHSAGCGNCQNAFLAAQRSAAILKFEAGRSPEPPPFFSARVMRALKENRSGSRAVWDLWKMWQASGALVSIMVAMVAVLLFVDVLAPGARGDAGPAVTADPTEAVIFEQDNTLKDITSEQIFQEVYER